MFPSFVLSLREGLEAALVIGIALGVLRKMHRSDLSVSVWAGAGVAAVLALLGAVVLNLIGGEFEGTSEQIFEGVTMLVAAGLLTWMIFWMRRQAAITNAELASSVRRAAQGAGKGALFTLALLAVGREGFELALFLVAARATSTALQTITGALLGLAGAAVLGWILFSSTRKLNLKQFFRVTNIVLIIFAAGLVASGIHEFNEAGIIPSVIDPIYNISFLFGQDTGLGELLKTLAGYSAAPSLTQMIAYLGYYIAVFFGFRWMPLPAPVPQKAA
jgi:high-affinity iron transporter